MNTKRRAGLAALIALALSFAPAICATAFAQQSGKASPTSAPQSKTAGYSLADLVQWSLAQNPTLSQGQFDIEAAQGRAIQAGKYPNPTVSVSGDEIGRRGGIQTLPQVGQEIVTGGKRGLDRAVADRGVDQAFLLLALRRANLVVAIRQGYFEALTLQKRRDVLNDLVAISTKSLENANQLLKAKQIADLDVLPFQIELNRLVLDKDSAEQDYIAAWGKLTATVGMPELALTRLAGSLETPLPSFNLEQMKAIITQNHPEVKLAGVGITKAQLVLQREQVQAIPNVTVAAGYQKNFNDRQNEFRYEVGFPLPIFNRNQGNIHAAQAEVGKSIQEVTRVQHDLLARLAAAYGQYASAKRRAEQLKSLILPDAERTYQLSLTAFKGGQFEYLRVIQAQRTIAEARLEYLRALGDAWRSASEISGLLLDEEWLNQP